MTPVNTWIPRPTSCTRGLRRRQTNVLYPQKTIIGAFRRRTATGVGPQFTVIARNPRAARRLHHATLSQDGKTMYLQGPVGSGRWGLFHSTNVGGKWGVPDALRC